MFTEIEGMQIIGNGIYLRGCQTDTKLRKWYKNILFNCCYSYQIILAGHSKECNSTDDIQTLHSGGTFWS